ncbi:MAG: trypsin-like peptidase domain-containing protein [Planctomycetaceae bacterium]|nr:trypsin-like peptidase domain-containing protein [Planctomycetaceae bacterium]
MVIRAWFAFLGWMVFAPPMPLSAWQGRGPQELAIGFAAADSNSDGEVRFEELKVYLTERLGDTSLPMTSLFEKIDANGDGAIDPAEFENRHAAIEAVRAAVEESFVPVDPGQAFVPFRGLDQPISDVGVFGAIYHRYMEQLPQREAWKSAGWKRAPLSSLAEQSSLSLPPKVVEKPSLEQLVRATLVIGGGGSDEEFFVGGGVIISPDGLAVTNYHIAEAFNKKLVGLMADGRVVRITEFVAGNRATDIAVVRLETGQYPWVPLSSKSPTMAEDVIVVHHTENRFFTYDRGYVKRFPLIGSRPWMEISADYAPGGSGCGIFNSNHELVGLVSTIVMGDGPMIGSSELMDDMVLEEGDSAENTEDLEGFETDIVPLVVKLAVPWSAIRAILPQSESR